MDQVDQSKQKRAIARPEMTGRPSRRLASRVPRRRKPPVDLAQQTKRVSGEAGRDFTFKEVWDGGLKLTYERHKAWRKQRKIDARHRPLEFCLRPHFALLLSTLALSLIGRGLTHFSGEAPYTAVWWSEELFWPVSALMGGWEVYSTSLRVESTLDSLRALLGWLYLGLGVWATLAPRLLSQSLTQARIKLAAQTSKSSKSSKSSPPSPKSSKPTDQGGYPQVTVSPDGAQRLSDPPRGARLAFKLCVLIMALQAHYVFALWWGHNLRWATVMEQAIHLALPLSCALMLPYTQPRLEPYAERILRLAVSFCFIGHGLYALDIAPLPASFLTMTLNLTPFDEEGARFFLSLIGMLDVIAALALWVPISELKRSALRYMIIWGGLTALARPLGEPSGQLVDRLLIWGPELIWRLPHLLAPLWLWRRARSASVSRVSTYP